MPLLLKACPKCGGDIELPRLPNNNREDPECIQCGFMVNLNSVTRMRKAKEAPKEILEEVVEK